MNRLQWLRDWLLERRIAVMQANIDWTDKHGNCTCNDFDAYGRIAFLDAELACLKSQRSPSQLKRMGVDSK